MELSFCSFSHEAAELNILIQLASLTAKRRTIAAPLGNFTVDPCSLRALWNDGDAVCSTKRAEQGGVHFLFANEDARLQMVRGYWASSPSLRTDWSSEASDILFQLCKLVELCFFIE